ncbi:MAG: hypothetical protein V4700_04665 [Pseudomonadota bacterium]
MNVFPKEFIKELYTSIEQHKGKLNPLLGTCTAIKNANNLIGAVKAIQHKSVPFTGVFTALNNYHAATSADIDNKKGSADANKKAIREKLYIDLANKIIGKVSKVLLDPIIKNKKSEYENQLKSLCQSIFSSFEDLSVPPLVEEMKKTKEEISIFFDTALVSNDTVFSRKLSALSAKELPQCSQQGRSEATTVTDVHHQPEMLDKQSPSEAPPPPYFAVDPSTPQQPAFNPDYNLLSYTERPVPGAIRTENPIQGGPRAASPVSYNGNGKNSGGDLSDRLLLFQKKKKQNIAEDCQSIDIGNILSNLESKFSVAIPDFLKKKSGGVRVRALTKKCLKNLSASDVPLEQPNTSKGQEQFEKYEIPTAIVEVEADRRTWNKFMDSPVGGFYKKEDKIGDPIPAGTSLKGLISSVFARMKMQIIGPDNLFFSSLQKSCLLAASLLSPADSITEEKRAVITYEKSDKETYSFVMVLEHQTNPDGEFFYRLKDYKVLVGAGEAFVMDSACLAVTSIKNDGLDELLKASSMENESGKIAAAAVHHLCNEHYIVINAELQKEKSTQLSSTPVKLIARGGDSWSSNDDDLEYVEDVECDSAVDDDHLIPLISDMQTVSCATQALNKSDKTAEGKYQLLNATVLGIKLETLLSEARIEKILRNSSLELLEKEAGKCLEGSVERLKIATGLSGLFFHGKHEATQGTTFQAWLAKTAETASSREGDNNTGGVLYRR